MSRRYERRDGGGPRHPPGGQHRESRRDTVPAGVIFGCNNQTMMECMQRSLFGLPMSQSGLVLRIAPGTTLFLFNFETKNLHGIFEATSPGGLDLDPSAFKARSSAGFPAQVWVRLRHDCTPLHESVFKDAIRANYFSPNKFNFELSLDQVKSLGRLFRAPPQPVGRPPGARSQQNPGPSSPVPHPPVARTDLRTVLIMKHSAERQRAERRQSEPGELERSSESPEEEKSRQSEEGRVEELERGTESPEPRRRSIFERLGDADAARSVRSSSGTPSDGPRAALFHNEDQTLGGVFGQEASPRGSKRRLEIDGSGGAGAEATREGKRTKKVSPVSSRLSLREGTGPRGEERNVASERVESRRQVPNKEAVQGRMVTGSGNGGHFSGEARAAASEDLKHGGGVVRLQPATMGDILRGKASGVVTVGRGDRNGLGGKEGGVADSRLKGSEGVKASRDAPKSGRGRGVIGGRKRALEEGEIASEGSGGAAGERKVTGGGVAEKRKVTEVKAGGLEGSRLQKRGCEEGGAEQGGEAKKAKEERIDEERGRTEGAGKGERNEAAAGSLGMVKNREKPALKASGGEDRGRDDGRRADGSEVREREWMPTAMQKEPGRKEEQAGTARPSDGRERGGESDKSGARAMALRYRDNRAAPRRDYERRVDGGRDGGKRLEIDRPSQRDARRSPSPRIRERQVERGVERPSQRDARRSPSPRGRERQAEREADRPAQRDARRSPPPRVRERQVERGPRKPVERGAKRSPRARSSGLNRPHLGGRGTERERENLRERRRESDERGREGARSHQQSAGRRPEGEPGARAPGGTPSGSQKGATSARHGPESGRELGQAGKGLYDRELERRRSEKGHFEVVRPKSAEGKREGESQPRGNGSKDSRNAASSGAVKGLAGQGGASGLLPRGVASKPARDCGVGMAPVEGRGVQKDSGLPTQVARLQEGNAKPAAELVAAPKPEDRGTGAMSGVRDKDGAAEWRGLVEIEAKRSNGTGEKAFDRSGGLSGTLEKTAGKAEVATGERKVLAAETGQSEAREGASAPVGGSASEQAHAGKVEETEGPRGPSEEAASAAGVGVSAMGGEENGAEENDGELPGDDLGADFLQLEADVDEPLPELESARKASITPFFLTLSETF